MRVKKKAQDCALKCNSSALLVVVRFCELLCYEHTTICQTLRFLKSHAQSYQMHLFVFHIKFLTAAQKTQQAQIVAPYLTVVYLQLQAVQSCTETSINTPSPDLLLLVFVFYLSVAAPLSVFI